MTRLSQQQRADLTAAERIRNRVVMRAMGAGLFDPKRKHAALPPALEPTLAIAERRKIHEAMTYFEAAYYADEAVLHVTWCPSDFYFKPGELDAKVILDLADRASRRARNLPVGRRLIGAVDISFNLELNLWCVHLHALLVVAGYSEKRLKRSVKYAFQPGRYTPVELSRLKPRKSKVIRNAEHLFNVFSYISACVALVDHNGEQRRDRRMRSRPEGSKRSSKSNLPPDLQAELTKVYAGLAPSRFWILSGFKRHGQNIAAEPPLTDGEVGAKLALTQPRPEPKPFTFAAVGKPLRLF